MTDTTQPPAGPRKRNRWKYDGMCNMNAHGRAPSITRADGSGFFLSGCTEAEARKIVQMWNRDVPEDYVEFADRRYQQGLEDGRRDAARGVA